MSSLLLTLIKKEILNNFLNLRILICYLIIFILIVVSVVIKGIQFEHKMDLYNENSAQFVTDLESKTENKWWIYNVQIPPRPISIFFEGFTREITLPFIVEVSPMEPFGEFNYENPIFKIYKVYDFIFIIAFILSLLALFISYDSVSGERESGVLKLILSHKVSKGIYILAKLIGGYLSLMIPTIIALLTGILVMLISTSVKFNGEDMFITLIIIILSSVSISIFFLIGTLFSIIFKSSSTAMFCSILVWITLGFGLPTAASYISKAIVPLEHLSTRINAYSKIKIEEFEVARTASKALAEKHRDDKTFDKGKADKKLWGDAHQRIRKKWIGILERHKRTIQSQIGWGINLGRISPIACFLFASSNTLKSGLYDFVHAENWKKDLSLASKKVYDDEMNRRRRKLDHLTYGKRENEVRKNQKFDLIHLPSRSYPGIGLATSIKNSMADIIILLIESVILFSLSYLIFIRKTDV